MNNGNEGVLMVYATQGNQMECALNAFCCIFQQSFFLIYTSVVSLVAAALYFMHMFF
jgi:hypothetical protein